ncbi:MAG: SurA N-terminal domain-containing protein [Proteobacteria bacterium]|nr:SurA N-terminal domain-containing protein [Pseudomonadota bacterium]
MKSKFKTCTNTIVILFIMIVMPGILIYKGQCSAEVLDRIVAVVNNELITLSDFTETTKAYTEKILSFGYPEDQEREMLFKMREDVLNQLIDQKLTDQQAKKYDLSVTDKELDNTLERIKESKRLTDEELRNMVAKDGLTFNEFSDKIKQNILRAKILDIEVKSRIVITRDDVKAYYESHKSEYMPQAVYHLFNIINRLDSNADNDNKIKALSIMETIYTKLTEGQLVEEIDKDYAESYGIETSDLGTFEFNELSQQIQDAIKDLKQKEFSKVLETDLGYQIIYIEEIKTKPGKSLDEATSEIQGILYNDATNEKFKLWVEELRQNSYIKIIK